MEDHTAKNVWAAIFEVSLDGLKEWKGTKVDGQDEGVDLNEFGKDEYDQKTLYNTWNSQRANKKLK